MIGFMWHTVDIINFFLFILHSNFTSQTASMPEMCEYILYPVLLKWKHENRRCFFPLLAFWFSGCFMLCIDVWQTVTCLWCALLPCSLLTPYLFCLTVPPQLFPHPSLTYPPASALHVFALPACSHVSAQHTLSDANLEDLHTQWVSNTQASKQITWHILLST